MLGRRATPSERAVAWSSSGRRPSRAMSCWSETLPATCRRHERVPYSGSRASTSGVAAFNVQQAFDVELDRRQHLNVELTIEGAMVSRLFSRNSTRSRWHDHFAATPVMTASDETPQALLNQIDLLIDDMSEKLPLRQRWRGWHEGNGGWTEESRNEWRSFLIDLPSVSKPATTSRTTRSSSVRWLDGAGIVGGQWLRRNAEIQSSLAELMRTESRGRAWPTADASWTRSPLLELVARAAEARTRRTSH